MSAQTGDSQPVRVRLAGCQADYHRLALLAQPYSALLQRVVFESAEPDTRFPDGERLCMSLLVPPSLLDRWCPCGDGIVSVDMGGHILFLEIMRTCARAGILSPEEIDG